ncbi:hypothetical protein BASA81_012896 [Batrachochytrium salamandrivorans]|nr:hypothetical protein BASA81_012896 [Batrachochytrium salamandrivorans]
MRLCGQIHCLHCALAIALEIRFKISYFESHLSESHVSGPTVGKGLRQKQHACQNGHRACRRNAPIHTKLALRDESSRGLQRGQSRHPDVQWRGQQHGQWRGQQHRHHQDKDYYNLPLHKMKRTKLDESSSLQHLGQIQRANLDFDFERICSVTLSPQRVYCCLVCGKFLQGKHTNSPLFSHALQYGHFVCINLATGEVFSLPEDILVASENSLEDVRFNLRPQYGDWEMDWFSKVSLEPVMKNRDLHGNTYFTGLLGMQGLDYVSAVVQSLVRVDALRSFFLKRENFETSKSVLVLAFGELVCQLFNHRRFKSSVSPNDLLRVIAANSSFSIKGMDASQFLAWLLFELNKGLLPIKVITECFQGEVEVETTLIEVKREFGSESNPIQPGPVRQSTSIHTKEEEEREGELGTNTKWSVLSTKTQRVKFLSLQLDLPTTRLFKDRLENSTVIPQTTLLQLLEKYNGHKLVDVPLPGGKLERKRYTITKLPRYLVFALKRFTPNQFFLEKNRALVTLPVVDLDMGKYCRSSSNTYRLVANVCHVDSPNKQTKNAMEDGTYKANVYYKPKDAWFEMDNIAVVESMPQLVAVSDTLLAFYERCE